MNEEFIYSYFVSNVNYIFFSLLIDSICMFQGSQFLIVENAERITVLKSVCLLGTGGEVKAKYSNKTIGISVAANSEVPYL